DICVFVPAGVAGRTVEALRAEFAPDVEHETAQHSTLDAAIAIVAVVGEQMRGIPGIVGRTFGALGRENVSIIAIAQGSSECNISVVVARKDMKAALLAAHTEFQLGALPSQTFPVKTAPATADKAESGAPCWQVTAPGLAQSTD